MQKRTLEAALQNVSADDPVVADRLAYFGPALLKVCEVARRLPTADLPDQARIEEALVRPDRTLLADAPVAIDPTTFEEVVREFAVVLHNAAHAEGSLSDAMKAVDWTRFTTPDLVEVARTRPSDYFDRVEEAAEGDDLLSYYILPVLGFALRAHLDRFAAQASAAIDRTDDVTDHDRPLACPVCGGLPDFASVHAITAAPAARTGSSSASAAPPAARAPCRTSPTCTTRPIPPDACTSARPAARRRPRSSLRETPNPSRPKSSAFASRDWKPPTKKAALSKTARHRTS